MIPPTSACRRYATKPCIYSLYSKTSHVQKQASTHTGQQVHIITRPELEETAGKFLVWASESARKNSGKNFSRAEALLN